MYQIVFNSVYVKFAVLFVLAFTCFQPIAPVFADASSTPAVDPSSVPATDASNTPQAPTDPVPADVQDQQVPPVQSETVAPASTTSDHSVSAANTQTATSSSTVETVQVATSSDQLPSTSTTTSSTASQTQNASTTSPVTASDTSTSSTSSDDSATTTQITNTDEGSTQTSASSSTNSINTTVATDTTDTTIGSTATDTTQATTTDGSVPGESVSVVNNDLNAYQFKTDECVDVGNGSYYCNKLSEQKAAGDDRIVFSAPDSDGDLEIYYNHSGTATQITHNTVDDSAPSYDSVSGDIVWQRLVNDRYQIVQYSTATKEEKVLTSSATNNMQPSQQGDLVVWQRWVGNNWEIVLYDGTSGTEKQLTDNTVHDVDPLIQGGYIIWHTNDADGNRKIAVYEIATGLTSFITDADGGQVSNPRFVLVYDTKFKNGDSITKGFDPKTGQLVPLSSQPGQVPVIPNADPTGQTRAIIQNKTQSVTDELLKNIPSGGNGTTTNTNNATSSATSTTTNAGDLDLNVSTNTASSSAVVATSTQDSAATSSTAVSDVLPLTDYDLIVDPYVATTSDAQSSSTLLNSSIQATTSSSTAK